MFFCPCSSSQFLVCILPTIPTCWPFLKIFTTKFSCFSPSYNWNKISLSFFIFSYESSIYCQTKKLTTIVLLVCVYLVSGSFVSLPIKHTLFIFIIPFYAINFISSITMLPILSSCSVSSLYKSTQLLFF